jgi:hypothetical protein
MYLTYAEYQAYGGTLSEADFTLAEFKARKRALNREYRQKKRELREKSDGRAKGKGKAKRGCCCCSTPFA